MCATLKYVSILQFDKEKFEGERVSLPTENLRSLKCQTSSFPIPREE